jgi:hypothetical protein
LASLFQSRTPESRAARQIKHAVNDDNSTAGAIQDAVPAKASDGTDSETLANNRCGFRKIGDYFDRLLYALAKSLSKFDRDSFEVLHQLDEIVQRRLEKDDIHFFLPRLILLANSGKTSSRGIALIFPAL